ncbi:MAG: hypothetical protein K1X92_09470 [Bacteroidia bacterium]|nr:hypothetical protein [Bacteroidia bacterium]
MENWLYKGRGNGGNSVLGGGNPVGCGNPTGLWVYPVLGDGNPLGIGNPMGFGEKVAFKLENSSYKFC